MVIDHSYYLLQPRYCVHSLYTWNQWLIWVEREMPLIGLCFECLVLNKCYWWRGGVAVETLGQRSQSLRSVPGVRSFLAASWLVMKGIVLTTCPHSDDALPKVQGPSNEGLNPLTAWATIGSSSVKVLSVRDLPEQWKNSSVGSHRHTVKQITERASGCW